MGRIFRSSKTEEGTMEMGMGMDRVFLYLRAPAGGHCSVALPSRYHLT